MKTVLQKSLEIENKLNITITMPQTCHFCGEEVTKKYGSDFDSLCIHSLDGNHDNWDPDNKVPAHIGCHNSFHSSNCSEETRRKISEKAIGRVYSAERNQNVSRAKKGVPRPDMVGEKNPMYGKSNYWGHHTDEAKRRISEAKEGDKNPMKDPEVAKKVADKLRGRKLSLEIRRRISEGHKGLVRSEEHKENLSKALKGLFMGSKNPMYGKHHTEEARKKISDALSGEDGGAKRGLDTRRERYGPSMIKNPGATWELRRERYGPSGMKSKEMR